jgi:colicin import membrane protein
MDELRESSLLFSLEGLLETERERVQREAREAERRREEELQRVAEVAERRRVAQEREREARARREALEQERQRLDEERLEAMRHATVERARIEAEARVRLVEADEQRKHELGLAKMKAEGVSARYKALAWLSSGASLLVVFGVVAAYLGAVRPAQAQAAQRYQSLVAESRVREQSSEQALRLERSRNEALRERVRVLEARAADVVPSPPGAQPPPPTRTPSGPRTNGGKPRPCGDSGDPLDNCLR